MQAALQLAGFWAFAFVTLCVALVLLNIYSDLIGYDFALQSAGKEAILAAVCSLIEAASVWVVITYIPAAARALFVPFLLVSVIYALAHLEDWNRFDSVIILVFQFAIAGVLVTLFTGYIGAALTIAAVFGGVLAVVASIAKGL